MTPQQIAENVKRYLTAYNNMLCEGELLAKERSKMLGGYQFDSSEYVKLKDSKPAYAAWKNAQADSVDIINALVQLVGEMELSIRRLQTHARATNNIIERKCKMYEICIKALTKAQPIAALAKEGGV